MNKKLLCLLLCFSVLLSCLCFFEPSTTASAATKSELEDRIEELDEQIRENKKKLEELKDKKESQKEYLDTLEDQIEAVEKKAVNLQTQMGVIDKEISELNDQLSQLTKEIKIIQSDIQSAQTQITETENDIVESSDLLAQKLRAAYMQGNESTLKILMGADSLASFLTRLEMMKRTSENDKKVIDDFKVRVKELKEKKAGLEEDKQELDAKKEQLSLKKAETQQKKDELTAKQKEYEQTSKSLESKYSEIEQYIEQLDKSGSAYQSYISELQDEKAKADAEIDRILSEYYATSVKETTTLPAANNADPTQQSSSSSGGSSGGGASQGAGPAYQGSGSWYWPLGNASCYISSPYGYRSASISGNAFHGGTDIAGGGISGKPVYASRAGKVITAVTSNRGYGIYVLLDHGDGYSTLYAHMSARYVSTGDTVSQGQMIGRVGSTGNSTGPHLHFEVRYYGEKKNPMNYVKKP